MMAARFRCIKDLPKEFYHDPIIKDNYGWTTAMMAAIRGCITDLPR